MFEKLFLFIYNRFFKIQQNLSIRYYKYLWKNQFECAPDFRVDNSVNIDIQSGEAKVSFAKGVTFRKYCNVICSNKGVLSIGENVFFNNYCSVNCLSEISIGADTIFGEAVKLYDHNHLFADKSKLIREQGMKYGVIKIGANCWIGSNTVILPNVTIGDNVVIGADNLIFKSVPSDTIVMAQAEKLFKMH